MHSEGYCTWSVGLFVCLFVGLSVCLSVCLSVRASSCTTGYEAANEWHQRIVNNEKMDINMAIFLKRLRSRDTAWKQAKKPMRGRSRTPSLAGYIARTRHVNVSPEHALRHIGCIIIYTIHGLLSILISILFVLSGWTCWARHVRNVA